MLHSPETLDFRRRYIMCALLCVIVLGVLGLVLRPLPLWYWLLPETAVFAFGMVRNVKLAQYYGQGILFDVQSMLVNIIIICIASGSCLTFLLLTLFAWLDGANSQLLAYGVSAAVMAPATIGPWLFAYRYRHQPRH